MLPSNGALHTYHGCFSTKTPSQQFLSDQAQQGLGGGGGAGGDEEVKRLTQDIAKERAWSSFRSEVRCHPGQHADPKQCPSQEGGLGPAALCSWRASSILPKHLCPSLPLSWGQLDQKAEPLAMLSNLPQMSPLVFVLTLLQSMKCYRDIEAICWSRRRLFLHTSLPSVILLPRQEGRPLVFPLVPNLHSPWSCVWYWCISYPFLPYFLGLKE